MGATWRQFKVLLWKNHLLRKRNISTFLIEVLVPVAFTFVLVSIANTVKERTIPEIVSMGSASTQFQDFQATYGKPDCPSNPNADFSDANIFWRMSSLSRCNAAAAEYLTFAVAPFSQDSAGAVSAAQRFSSYAAWASNHSVPLKYFDSDAALNGYINQDGYSQSPSIAGIGVAVIFRSGAPEWDYDIRFNHTTSGGFAWNIGPTFTATNDLARSPWDKPDGRSKSGSIFMYHTSGVLSVQNLVDSFILNTTVATHAAYPHLSATLRSSATYFPAPAYKMAGFWGSVGGFFGVLVVITLLYPVSNVIRNLVLEKEMRLREGMRMMSLGDLALFGSWWVHYSITFCLMALFIMLAGSVKLWVNSNKFLVLLWYLSFLHASMSFAFAASSFFSRAKTAALIGILPYFIGFFITSAINRSTPKSSYALASLHPVAAFSLATDAFAKYEDSGIGVTWNTWRTPVGTSPWSFADSLGMLFLDMWLYLFVFWFAEKTVPNEYGTTLPLYFLFTKNYWQTVLPNSTQLQLGWIKEGQGDVQDAEAPTFSPEAGDDIEKVPDALSRQLRDGNCVAMRDLRKDFQTPTGIKKAVDGLSLTLYSGQITALLGHNGAGKTTTMSMLTGLIPPSAGTAYITGLDIATQMKRIRGHLGVCPQHDVLFADLTVQEHLQLFAAFKGLAPDKVGAAVEEMIKEVGLTEKRHVASKNLSGGMKRKLSVGIAFIGGSKVVILDEPTSGMDPYSRRFTWNVIRKYREGRIIVLSTHFMDEADLLGDRIAIMSRGRLRCCGSSLFLKAHFGVGYNVVMEKRNGADEKALQQYVLSHIPEGKLLSNVGAELSFQLPLSASSRFPALLSGMDDRGEELGIETYGLSVTTLEEVFLRVAHDQDDDPSNAAHKTLDTTPKDDKNNGTATPATAPGERAMSPPPNVENIAANNDSAFFTTHMAALLHKRAAYFRRDTKTWCFTFGLPAIFVLAGLFLIRLGGSQIFNVTLPTITLDAKVYNPKAGHENPFPVNAPQPFQLYMMDTDSNNPWPSPGIQDGADYNGKLDSTVQPVVAPGITYVEDFSRYLLDTRSSTKASRYGAVAWVDMNSTSNDFLYTVFANYTGLHAAPIFSNLANEAIIRQYDPSVSIKTTLRQLPVTKHMYKQAGGFDSFYVCIMILLAMPFISSSFMLFIVREREQKAKHLQVVSGVSFLAYWLSTWIWDFLSYQVPCWTIVILIKIFEVDALIKGENASALIALLVLYGASVTSFTQLFSFAFEKHSNAQVVTIFVNLLFGLMLSQVSFILSIFPNTRELQKKLIYAFRLHPSFCLGHGIITLGYRDFFGQIEGKTLGAFAPTITGIDLAFMAWQIPVFFLLTLAMEAAVRSPAFITQFRAFFGGASPLLKTELKEEKDADVAREEERVGALADPATASDVVVLKDLKKVYAGGKYAVRGLSLGINKGECFGLLGINGAGKTTTLSILTGEFPPSHGQAWLGGYDLLRNPEVVRRLVGYCPQFDALFDLLTGREHLQLYARIKGIPERHIKTVVEEKIKEMDLVEYADRQASTYSGGNKRKLSVSMAMIGNPRIVFLDEPSTGMDPVARRFMWQVIADISTRKGECCVVLTTHSMEECEALCSRMGIMVGGRLRCLGSAQHLKTRFGMGYQTEISLHLPEDPAINEALARANVTLPHDVTREELTAFLNAVGKTDLEPRITATGSGAEVFASLEGRGAIGAKELASWALLEGEVDAVVSFIESTFPGSVLRERQGARVRYEIPSADGAGQRRRLSDMFGSIEAAKQRLMVDDYSLSQTSLEQIFNRFAAQQEEEQGTVLPNASSLASAKVSPMASPVPFEGTPGEGTQGVV